MDLSAALFLYFSLAIALSLLSLPLFLCAVLYLCGRQINENLQKDEVAISEARGHEPLRLLCLLRLLIGLGTVKFSSPQLTQFPGSQTANVESLCCRCVYAA